MSQHLGPLRVGRDLWARTRDSVSGLARRLASAKAADDDLADVEVAVKEVLQPVAPASDFRQSLRSSLDRAEYARREGIIVDDPPPYREGILLGMGATILAMVAVVIWLISRWRARARAASR